MKTALILAFASVGILSGCALEATHDREDDNAIVKTQVMPEPLAACIARALGSTASPLAKGGFSVDASGVRLVIARDEIQTIVGGPEGVLVPSSISDPVIQCTLELTPKPPKN